MSSFSCVVLAGGNGVRFGGRKQFKRWQGKELWRHVAEKARSVCDDVVVVGVDIPGGRRRCDSVFNGLKKICHDRVVICEAARPGVTVEQIKNIGIHKSPSVSYAVPSVSTVACNGRVLTRQSCLSLQVPQAFDTGLLIEAHRQTKNVCPTDDTMLMYEVHGILPVFLEGGRNLLKVTYPEDFVLLEALL